MQIDRALIKACQSNHRESQKHLYQELLPYLRAIVYRYLKDNSYVKDVLQESFIKIFKRIDTFDIQRTSFKSWASRIAVNTALNYNQRMIGDAKKELESEGYEVIVFPQIIGELSNEDVLKILKQMPASYYEVFNLFVIDGYSHEEIAKLLCITVVLSRKRLSRARSWLNKTFPDKSRFSIDNISIPKKIKS